MVSLENDFHEDLSTLLSPTFTVLPVGKYKAIITGAELTDNRAGNGTLLVLTLEVIEGQFKGVSFRDNINYRHPDSTTQRIALERKARIGVILLGTPNPKDTNDILNKPLIIDVKHTSNGDKTYNNVKQYYPLNGDFEGLINKKTTPNTQPSNGRSISDDEIPF
jgi:hypothetical protein